MRKELEDELIRRIDKLTEKVEALTESLNKNKKPIRLKQRSIEDIEKSSKTEIEEILKYKL